MDVALIDYWALHGGGPYHRASAGAKMLATALVIAAVLIAGDVVTLTIIYLLLAGVTATSRLPMGKVLLIAAYPATFGVLFALSRWDGTLAAPATIILRAMDAGLATVLLIVTTPYSEIFRVLRLAIPSPYSDALFLTYRSLFLLLRLVSELLIALRIRGGFVRWRYLRTVRNIGQGLGHIVVHAIALTERFYQVLRVRGYSGAWASPVRGKPITVLDLVPVAVGTGIFFIAFILRMLPSLRQVNGFLLVGAALVFAVSFVVHRKGLRVATETELWKR